MSAMSSSQSIYRGRLDPARCEIRLLEIVSADGDPGPVRCRLGTVSLNEDPPEFCALSYVWGDPKITTEVLVAPEEHSNEDSEPVYFSINATVNLEAALRHVRSQWAAHRGVAPHDISKFRLWADAICTNQADMEERSQQVEMMGRIFRSADLVLAWLGQQDLSLAFGALENIASAATYMKENSNLQEFIKLEWLRAYPDLCGETETWKQIFNFLQDPYWTRVWIFQERVLARELLFVAPGTFIPFRRASHVAKVMMAVYAELNGGLRATVAIGRPDWLPYSSWKYLAIDGPPWYELGITPLIFDDTQDSDGEYDDEEHDEHRGPPDNKDALGDIKWAHSCWGMLHWKSAELNATDPKDHVYGLLAVSNLRIKPDYTENTSLGDVYLEYVGRWLDDPRSNHPSHNPLDFLGLAGSGLGSYTPEIPSWVPSFHKAKRHYRLLLNDGREKRADRGVFDFTASTPAEHEKSHLSIKASTLSVTGLVLEPVIAIQEAQIETARSKGQLVAYLSDFVARHPTYVSGTTIFTAVVQLILHDTEMEISESTIQLVSYLLLKMVSDAERLFYTDKTIDDVGELLMPLGLHQRGDTWTVWFARNIVDAFERPQDLGWDDFFRTTADNINARGVQEQMGSWHESIYSKIDSCRFFETESGYLGIAPGGVQPGDELCILKDCVHPVLLRSDQQNPCDSSGQRRFTYVGPTFVAGLMNGEAVYFIQEGIATPETVVLV